VTTVWHGPLCRGEARGLLDARLARAGAPGSLIDDAAFAALELYSRRIPRLLFLVAGAAFFTAESEGAIRLEAEHVAEGAALHGLSPPPGPLSGAQPQTRLEDLEEPTGESLLEELVAFLQAEPDYSDLVSLPRRQPGPVPECAQRTRWPRSAERAPTRNRTVWRRRATALVLCLVASSAAADGWIVAHQPTVGAAMHSDNPAPFLAAAAMPHAVATSRAAPPVARLAAGPSPDASRIASVAVPATLPPSRSEPGPRGYAETHAPGSSPSTGVLMPAEPSVLARAVPPLSPSGPRPHRSSGSGVQPYGEQSRVPNPPLHAVTAASVVVSPPLAHQPAPVHQPPLFAQQFQQVPQRYVGMYVTLPDGRRTFIPNP
jgi:hypothetical protein